MRPDRVEIELPRVWCRAFIVGSFDQGDESFVDVLCPGSTAGTWVSVKAGCGF